MVLDQMTNCKIEQIFLFFLSLAFALIRGCVLCDGYNCFFILETVVFIHPFLKTPILPSVKVHASLLIPSLAVTSFMFYAVAGRDVSYICSC